MDWKIGRAERGLKGEIVVPADKSISHRAIMFGSISSGTLKVDNFLSAEDCLCTLKAFRNMGIDISSENGSLVVKGKGLRGLKAPSSDLYMGNSGTSMRIIAGILAGQNFDTCLSGDASLSTRPMGRIVEPLSRMGALITTTDGVPPICIKAPKGRLKSFDHVITVASAQVKSCLLSAGLYADGMTSVTEPFQSRDHTERMLKYFSADIQEEGLTTKLKGGQELVPKDVIVPGDISSAAFFIVAALLTGDSELILKNVGLNPTRVGILKVLKRMGADICVEKNAENCEPYGNIRVISAELCGTVVLPEEIPSMIDEVPILMLAACVAEGDTEIRGISELKVKESDRVKTMTNNLKRMGLDVIEENNSLFFKGGVKKLEPAILDSFGDHRIAMTMAVAALLSGGECAIKNTDCVDTSYPGFLNDLKSVVSK